jgi:hypothetical protein
LDGGREADEMMVLRMFVVFFGLLVGYYAILELVAPYLQYWGIRLRAKLNARLSKGVIVYYPPSR